MRPGPANPLRSGAYLPRGQGAPTVSAASSDVGPPGIGRRCWISRRACGVTCVSAYHSSVRVAAGAAAPSSRNPTNACAPKRPRARAKPPGAAEKPPGRVNEPPGPVRVLVAAPPLLREQLEAAAARVERHAGAVVRIRKP